MTKHVLLIDDEPAILMAFKKLLQSPGIEIDTAETKESAQSALNQKNYDAVIADLRLGDTGGEEGLELLRFVKQHNPAVPTILITAYGNPEVMEKTYRLGADLYLEKPVSSNTLKDALKKLGVQ
ncbi:MAG: response regulator [Thermodesulfovibrionales bacterium]|jgi:DNA-binding NtrC family response regulator|nr:response regulator [Thermodesulfovibrionales bacterium]